MIEWVYDGAVSALSASELAAEVAGYPEIIRERVAMVEIGDRGRYARITLKRAT